MTSHAKENLTALEPAVCLDTVGLFCPVPVLKTARKIREIAAGEVIEILSDDPVILEDMPAWCRANGHEYLGSLGGGEEELRLFVRRLR